MCACVGLGSALLMGLSKMAHAYEMLFVGRALSGLVTGKSPNVEYKKRN